MYMTASYLTPLVLKLNLMPLDSRVFEREDSLLGMVTVVGGRRELERSGGVAGQLLGMSRCEELERLEVDRDSGTEGEGDGEIVREGLGGLYIRAGVGASSRLTPGGEKMPLPTLMR